MILKRVLVAIFTHAHFTELLRVIDLLTTDPQYHVTVLWDYPASETHLACLRERGIYSLDPYGAVLDAPMQIVTAVVGHGAARNWKSVLRASIGVLPRSIGRPLLALLLALYAYPASLRRRFAMIRLAERLLKSHKIDVVVMAEDNVGYPTAEWIRAAHTSGARAVIVPYTMANIREPAESLYRAPLHSTKRFENRLAGMLFPRWCIEYRGHRFLRLPAVRLATKELLGLAPPQPWVINSGEADAIAAESDEMREYYTRAGLPAEKLIVTGSAADDTLAASLTAYQKKRELLSDEMGIKEDGLFVLCALPPDQHDVRTEECEYLSYEALVKAWNDTFEQVGGIQLVMCAHPRTSRSQLAQILGSLARVSTWDTAQLIPLCDIYVASASATIRWAIACGKPVLNYDVYRYGYSDFQHVPGVVTVTDRSQFRGSLERLIREPSYREQLKRAQSSVASRWGRLDAHAGERIKGLLDRLIEGRQTSK